MSVTYTIHRPRDSANPFRRRSSDEIDNRIHTNTILDPAYTRKRSGFWFAGKDFIEHRKDIEKGFDDSGCAKDVIVNDAKTYKAHKCELYPKYGVVKGIFYKNDKHAEETRRDLIEAERACKRPHDPVFDDFCADALKRDSAFQEYARVSDRLKEVRKQRERNPEKERELHEELERALNHFKPAHERSFREHMLTKFK